MTPQEFMTALDEVFGLGWNGTLAAHFFNVNRRTLLKWVGGEAPIPRGVAADLGRLVARRRAALTGSPSVPKTSHQGQLFPRTPRQA